MQNKNAIENIFKKVFCLLISNFTPRLSQLFLKTNLEHIAATDSLHVEFVELHHSTERDQTDQCVHGQQGQGCLQIQRGLEQLL